jgi:hypothetical protein
LLAFNIYYLSKKKTLVYIGTQVKDTFPNPEPKEELALGLDLHFPKIGEVE